MEDRFGVRNCTGEDDATELLIDEMQRGDAAPYRIAIEELRDLLTVKPIIDTVIVWLSKTSASEIRHNIHDQVLLVGDNQVRVIRMKCKLRWKDARLHSRDWTIPSTIFWYKKSEYIH